MAAVATFLLNALGLVLLQALVAVGLAVVFGMMGVVNLAHGEFFMLGAYAAALVDGLRLSFWWSILLAPLLVGLVGLGIELAVVRFLYQRPMESLLATWGVSMGLVQVVELIAGKGYRTIPNPLTGALHLGAIRYPLYRIVIMGLGLAAVALLFWLLERTDFGARVRAATANPRLALVIGIDTAQVTRWAFVLGAAMAGLAGALLAPVVSIYPTMGTAQTISAFLTVVVGGLGSLPGLLLAALILGGVQGTVQQLAGNIVAQVALLALAILIIRFRPRGLLR